ncbi:MAG: LysR family transcriptional regulator [Pseudomonadota bacterium]
MTTPDWEALRTFSWVAKTGSMAGAAEELGCAVSTVGRRIDGLEQSLGLTLLHRARIGAVPTEVGQAILASVDQAARSLDEIPRQARYFVHFRDRKTVRLSATETVINDILMPRISELRGQYPNLLLEFEATNSHASLEFGETDLAIRLVQPKQSELVTRKLAPVKIAFFVSEIQLAGRKAEQVSLEDEDLVWIDSGLGDIAENRLIHDLGIVERITLRATSVRALAVACSQGQGIAMLPSYMGHELGLHELRHIGAPRREAWLVFHPETRNDPVLRNVRKWVVRCFSETFGLWAAT